MLVAACLWGTTGTVRTFVPSATNLSIAAVRIAIGGLLLLLLAASTARSAGLGRLVGARRNWLPLVAGALAMTTYQTAFFSAAARTGVAIGTVVTIGSAPALTGLLGLVTRQSPLTRRWTVATGGAVAGSAALIGGGSQNGADPGGIGLALLSGLAYAVYTTVASTLLARGEDERAVTGAVFGAAAVFVLPSLASGSAAWALTGAGAIVAFYLACVTTAGGYLLFARGLRTTPATTATTLTLAESAVAALLGIVVLDEQLSAAALSGLAILAASLALLVVPRTTTGTDEVL